MSLELQNMLAGVGMGGGEEDREARVDCFVFGIHKARERCAARGRELAENDSGYLRNLGPRNTDDADTAPSRRRRRRNDGVHLAHAPIVNRRR